MEVDLILASLLVLLGAKISYILDEIFEFTPWLSAVLSRLLG